MSRTTPTRRRRPGTEGSLGVRAARGCARARHEVEVLRQEEGTTRFHGRCITVTRAPDAGPSAEAVIARSALSAARLALWPFGSTEEPCSVTPVCGFCELAD